MSTGFWINQDGLPLQFGTQKAIPEMGGDYQYDGENRLLEAYICLGNTTFGATGSLQVPSLPSSFSGTGTPIAAGIQSMTTLFPLNAIATPVSGGDSNGNTTLSFPQLYIEEVDLQCLISANAGTGGATGLTGIGLVTINPATGAFVQVTPNAGVQILGSCVNARMTAGQRYQFTADGTTINNTTIGTAPTAGSWLGRVPLVTNSITPLPTDAFLSVTAAGGTYTGSSAAGLLKVRIRYGYYGTINQ